MWNEIEDWVLGSGSGDWGSGLGIGDWEWGMKSMIRIGDWDLRLTI